MKRNYPTVIQFIAFILLFVSSLSAQNSKKHVERFLVKDEVDIHVNTSHTNVKLETWDKDEVIVTFTLESDEETEAQFEKWNYEATGNSSKVNIKSQSGFHFNSNDFQFDFDMNDFDFKMDDFNIDLSGLNLDIENMVSGIVDGLNLDDIPRSPFGKNADFDGDEYRKNPNAYLRKMNKKHGTEVSEKEVDQWLEDLKGWSNNIDIKIKIDDDDWDMDEFTERMSEHSRELKETVKKWKEENKEEIKEMKEKMKEKVHNMKFNHFHEHRHQPFDHSNSDVKKTIHIKMPKNAKLHLNVRYGEVTLAQHLHNVNADLNYATLAANVIGGPDTDISAAYAPVYINHWQNGVLNLRHCKNSTIEKAAQIDLNAQGTDIFIGTILQSGVIKSAYGDLDIRDLGPDFQDLNLGIDFGGAAIHIRPDALDLLYTGNGESSFSIPSFLKLVSDSRNGKKRVVKAYSQKPNSGKTLSVRSNYGNLTLH